MYEIIVKKDVAREIPEGKEYEKIADTGGDDGGSKYGYVMRPAKTVVERKVVFQQEVENLDIVSVISAINSIKF